MELKKLVLLCKQKLHMKLTTSLYSNIIKCTKFLFFYIFHCNLKEKDHIKRNIKSKKRNVYAGNQFYYYHLGLSKIRVGWAHATKN